MLSKSWWFFPNLAKTDFFLVCLAGIRAKSDRQTCIFRSLSTQQLQPVKVEFKIAALRLNIVE